MDTKKLSNSTETFRQIVAGLENETERALAIVVSSYLEHLLRELISSGMMLNKNAKDFLFDSPNAGLGTFSSRVEMAHKMALITKSQKRDLDLIRKIRNLFAHEFSGLSFNTSEIRNRCIELSTEKIKKDNFNPRRIFTQASVQLMVDINILIKKIESQQFTSTGLE